MIGSAFNSLQRYLSAVANLCDASREFSPFLASKGLRLSEEYWSRYSDEANQFDIELAKEWTAAARVEQGIVGYRSPLVSTIMRELNLNRSVLRTFNRPAEIEARVRSHPALAGYTIESAKHDSSTFASESRLKIRNAELHDIGESRVLEAIGLANLPSVDALTYDHTLKVFDEAFARCGFKRLPRRVKWTGHSQSCVAAYGDPAGAHRGRFFLAIESLPGFSGYFGVEISMGVAGGLSERVDGIDVTVREDGLNRWFGSTLRGFGSYTAAQLKPALATTLYAFTLVIPEVIRRLHEMPSREQIQLQWIRDEP